MAERESNRHSFRTRGADARRRASRVPSHAPSHRESLCKLIRCYNNFFPIRYWSTLCSPKSPRVASKLALRLNAKMAPPRGVRSALAGDCYSSRAAGCIQTIRRYLARSSGRIRHVNSSNRTAVSRSAVWSDRFANDSKPASSASSARYRAPPHAGALQAGVVFVLAHPSLFPRNASFHVVAMVPNDRPRASTCRRFARKFHSETPCSREASSRFAFAICSRERCRCVYPHELRCLALESYSIQRGP
mmetsp:Transcript_6882/g.27684  ORF Transcript_6882/g.27684 Transcript_6882/m.27684 type:complete len:247 (+) Transcript_6882:878-1618(+)